MKVRFLELDKLNGFYSDQLSEKLSAILDSGRVLFGPFLKQFESAFAAYTQTSRCIAVGSGLDGIKLILEAYKNLGRLEEGDEIIVPANTYFATILGILQTGLKPVLAEPDPETFNINVDGVERVLTNRTKAVFAVHLYGKLCPMEELAQLCKNQEILLLDDAAHAHGAESMGGKKVGSLADATAFSFYPTKNLGALGDGGAVTTSDEELANEVAILRNYGTAKKDILVRANGMNSRMDEIQAAFLDLKLKDLDDHNRKRKEVAEKYCQGISNSAITLPKADMEHVYHQFVIQCENREGLKDYLMQSGIETMIHYPLPPHKQEGLAQFSHKSLPITEKIHEQALSLPIHPLLQPEEVDHVISTINSWK